MSEGVKAFIMICVIGLLAANLWWSIRLESIKKEELAEYKRLVNLLEVYKPVTISTTLQTDDKFMKVLISKLSEDKGFLDAVTKQAKTKN
jgi:hypothetical protein